MNDRRAKPRRVHVEAVVAGAGGHKARALLGTRPDNIPHHGELVAADAGAIGGSPTRLTEPPN